MSYGCLSPIRITRLRRDRWGGGPAPILRTGTGSSLLGRVPPSCRAYPILHDDLDRSVAEILRAPIMKAADGRTATVSQLACKVAHSPHLGGSASRHLRSSTRQPRRRLPDSGRAEDRWGLDRLYIDFVDGTQHTDQEDRHRHRITPDTTDTRPPATLELSPYLCCTWVSSPSPRGAYAAMSADKATRHTIWEMAPGGTWPSLSSGGNRRRSPTMADKAVTQACPAGAAASTQC